MGIRDEEEEAKAFIYLINAFSFFILFQILKIKRGDIVCG
jgi:hypothetical protein